VYEEDKESAAYREKVINFGIGWVKYAGDANAVAELTGNSAGSWLSPPPDEGEYHDSLQEAEQGMSDEVEGLDIEGGDFDALTSSMSLLRQEMGATGYTHG
jgi:hypothetical protein